MEELSSSATFLHKFVFSPLWFVLFGLATLRAWQSADLGTDQTWPVFGVAWIVGGLFLWRTCAPFKRVRLSGNSLLISNFFREAAVPVALIESVSQNVALSMKPIRVRFRAPTPFGKSVVFMPPMSFRILSEDDIVQRLRALADPTRARATPSSDEDGASLNERT